MPENGGPDPEFILEEGRRMATGRSVDDLPEPEVPMQHILHAGVKAAVDEGERHGLGRNDLRVMIFADVPPDVEMKFRTGMEVVGPVGSPPEVLAWALEHLQLFAEKNNMAFFMASLEDGEATGPPEPKA